MLMKRKGLLAIPVTLMAVVYLFLAGTFFTLYSSQFSMIQAGRTALQAQQYAEVDSNTLSLLAYTDLDTKGAHSRQAITNIVDAAGWEDEIVIGPETIIDVDNRQRIATVKVYKTGDTLARYSLQVPLSSKGSSGVPSGTICIWHSSAATIPDGWVLCDGTNGTPDLRSRFVYGAGGDTNTKTAVGHAVNELYGHWAVGFTHGQEYLYLTAEQMPSHTHTRGTMNITGFFYGTYGYGGYSGGCFSPAGVEFANNSLNAGGDATYIQSFNAANSWTGETSAVGSGAEINNLPPLMCLCYIMKK